MRLLEDCHAASLSMPAGDLMSLAAERAMADWFRYRDQCNDAWLAYPWPVAPCGCIPISATTRPAVILGLPRAPCAILLDRVVNKRVCELVSMIRGKVRRTNA